MRRWGWILLAVLLAGLWASRFVVDPRPPTGPTDPAPFIEAAERAYEDGEWETAVENYRLALRLLDPRDASLRAKRSEYALYAGWALKSRIERTDEGADLEDLERLRRRAVSWFEVSRRIGPDDGRAHFLEGRLFDRIPEPLREPKRAVAAYRRYLTQARKPEFAAMHVKVMISSVESRIEHLESP